MCLDLLDFWVENKKVTGTTLNALVYKRVPVYSMIDGRDEKLWWI